MQDRIQKSLQGLRRRFSKRPNFIQGRNGATRLPQPSLRAHWILGRGLCMYRCENFDHVPRARREAAVKLQVPGWSPFDRTEHYVVWAGGDAMVWYWDAEAVDREAMRDQVAEAGADPAHCLVLPESVFRPRQANGLCVQQCAEGFEIQYWQGGLLRSAVWSLEQPSAQRVALFAERQGTTADAVEVDELLAEPWAAQMSPREWLVANELRVAAGLALLLSTLLIWQEGRHGRLALAGQGADRDFAAIQEEVAPFMAARNEHRRLSGINDRLDALLREPSQAYLMGLIDQTLPNPEARFAAWHYQQGELKVVIEDAAADPVQYVRLVEELPVLADVRVEQARGRNRVELTMQVAR